MKKIGYIKASLKEEVEQSKSLIKLQDVLKSM